ncbi:MAG: hypothetical protein R3250_00505 [Melioribacteraceae bacterium]|nr:hypothetical protein [Melioribacteraceae bacterium]
MNLVLQIVNNNIQDLTVEVSFFSEYKYWILFVLLLVVILSLRLYKYIKYKKSFWQVDEIVNEKIYETMGTHKPQKESKPVKNLTPSKSKQQEDFQKPDIELIHSEEDLNSVEEIRENAKVSKRNQEKQLIQPVQVDEPIIEIIVSEEVTTTSKIKTIAYQPTDIFEQGSFYQYPLVVMPKPSAKIKFPRKGCSNKQGYTEDAFFEYLQSEFENDFQVLNDRHVPSKNGNFVYEPDIVLINEKNGKNIFIDIEIDEPYEAFSRTPTHEAGIDAVRNKFFTDRGWIVVRFSEIQIHQNPKECCYHIAKVIAALDPEYEIPFHLSLYGDLEQNDSWDSLQAKKWAKQNYREEYLGIDSFGARPNIISNYDIVVSANDELLESAIEDDIEIPKYEKIEGPLSSNEHKRDKRLRFDPIEHRYYIDGNPDTISASQLIAKFFPEFDSEYWSQRKAMERAIGVEEILLEWETKRDNAANLGTALHEEIENYYNGLDYDRELPEFQHFLKFKEKYPTMKPYRSEWRVFDEEFLVAGTIDMVYQKEDDELYMFDWKRSEKVVDHLGIPKLPSYDYASGELSHLSDNSFNKYALQQNIYKYILEKNYDKKITSMNLLILHPSFDTYHHVKLPDLTKEVAYIFENSKNYR